MPCGLNWLPWQSENVLCCVVCAQSGWLKERLRSKDTELAPAEDRVHFFTQVSSLRGLKVCFFFFTKTVDMLVSSHWKEMKWWKLPNRIRSAPNVALKAAKTIALLSSAFFEISALLFHFRLSVYYFMTKKVCFISFYCILVLFCS